MELPLTEGNPLAPLVIALQEEIAQLKEEIRKRDSMPDHIRVLQLEARVQELEKELATYAPNLQSAKNDLEKTQTDPDLAAANFVLQYDPTDRNAFLDSGIPRAAADLFACCKGLPDKLEFFKRVVMLVETVAEARLSTSMSAFSFWFSVLTATAHLMEQAGYDIYSPAESGVIVTGFHSSNAALKLLADAITSCYLKLHLTQFSKIAKLLISAIVSNQGSSISSRFRSMEETNVEDVLRLLSEFTDALIRNGVATWVLRQVVAQLMLFITTHLFNQVIKVGELCTATVGLAIRFLLAELQRWLSSKPELVQVLECCNEIAQPLTQLASLLIMDKSNLMYAALFSSERNLSLYFPALNAQQVHKVLSQFTPDSSCPNAVPEGLVNKIAGFAAKQIDIPLLLDMKRMIQVEELRAGSLPIPGAHRKLPLQAGDDDLLTWVLNSPRRSHRRAVPPDVSVLRAAGASNLTLIETTESHIAEYCNPSCSAFSTPQLEAEDRMQYHYRDCFLSRPHYHIVGTSNDSLGAVIVTVEEAMPLQQRVRALVRTCDGNRHITLSADDVVRELRQNMPELGAVALTKLASPELNAALLEYEANLIERSYKIAVLLCRPGQTQEQEWYRNLEVPESLEIFLSMMGERIPLKGWSAYTGGLDTREGLTGTHSYYTRFANVEVMFHVAPLLPPRPDDAQQVDRKRHLGNDVCMIIFREEGCQEPLRPELIRSHFNHVFAVVEPDTTTTGYAYRVAFATKKDVPPFGPPLPMPGTFNSSPALREFLLAKLINGERSAVTHAQEFLARGKRARGSALQHIISQHLRRENGV